MVKMKRKISKRAPTPYEAAKDYLQISSNILLTFAIVILMLLQLDIIQDITTRGVIIIALTVLLIIVLIDMYKFYFNWVKWVKKK